jgi:uncharacterized protein HemY
MDIFWTAIFGIALIIASGIGLAMNNGKPSDRIIYDEKTGRLVDTTSVIPTFILFLLVWAYLSFWILAGGFTNSVRMPWG